MISKLPFGHLKISPGIKNEFLTYIEDLIEKNKRAYCIPLNLTKYVISKNDFKLREAINSADMIIADGMAIVWLSRRLGYKNVFRVTGIDLAEEIISRSKKFRWKLYFFGASSKNLEKAIDNIRKKFNRPDIVGYHHGYFKSNEIDRIINNINNLNADILFIGLGLPQKEYFIQDHFDKIKARFCLPIGGAFDVWAETKKRSPQLVQKTGLEWLYRSFSDRSKGLYVAKYSLAYLKDFIVIRNKTYYEEQ